MLGTLRTSPETKTGRCVVKLPGRARHSVRAATSDPSPERRARSDAPCHTAEFARYSLRRFVRGRKIFSAFPFAGLLSALALLTGCKSIGPGTVPRDRFEYSASISESWKRQTLLNIVKLRYLDPPIFVDVGQIVAGYSLETGLTAGGSLPETTAFGGNTATLGGSVRFTDRPTITYTPLTGNKFVKALMTPLPPDAVFFTLQSGYPADAVFSAAVGAMNGLKNQESSLAGVSPPDPDFVRALELLRNIQLSGAVGMRIQQDTQK